MKESRAAGAWATAQSALLLPWVFASVLEPAFGG